MLWLPWLGWSILGVRQVEFPVWDGNYFYMNQSLAVLRWQGCPVPSSLSGNLDVLCIFHSSKRKTMNSFVKVEPGAGTKAVSPTLVFARKKKKNHGCNHLWLPLLALSSLAHTLPETLASSPLSSVSGSPWVGWFALAAPLPATPCAKTLDISEVFCNYVEEKAPPLSSTSCIPSLLCFV